MHYVMNITLPYAHFWAFAAVRMEPSFLVSTRVKSDLGWAKSWFGRAGLRRSPAVLILNDALAISPMLMLSQPRRARRLQV